MAGIRSREEGLSVDWTIAIPIERVDNPFACLVDQAATAAAQAGGKTLAGVEVVSTLDASPGAAPVFGLAPHELAVSGDGAVVNVMLSGFVVVDPLVEDLYGRVRPAWFDAPRELSASEVEAHVLRLLAWRGGRKVLAVRPSELLPGLCKVDLHLVPEAAGEKG